MLAAACMSPLLTRRLRGYAPMQAASIMAMANRPHLASIIASAACFFDALAILSLRESPAQPACPGAAMACAMTTAVASAGFKRPVTGAGGSYASGAGLARLILRGLAKSGY